MPKTDYHFHHVGFPTSEPKQGERYMEDVKVHVTGFDSNEFGIEWLRFEPGTPMPELVQRMAHVAFQVNDLDAAMQGRKVIFGPHDAGDGIRFVYIESDGAPVELIEIS